MFSGRRFAIRNPVKPAKSYRPHTYHIPSSYKKRRSSNWSDDDYDDSYGDIENLVEVRTEYSANDDNSIPFSGPPPPLRFVYIVSQSNTDILATDKTSGPCIDKVISVHATKASANEAAETYLRAMCGVKPSTKVDKAREMEYHEGLGARGLFVGSMRIEGTKKENGRKRVRDIFVRVETQKWEVR